MICLVPISRFRVRFDVCSGRPYSQLERMVLRAIKEGVTDLESMRMIFQVHPRILIEALVTLTQAGWVSFSGEVGGGFLLTSDGAAATSQGQSPSTTTVTSKTTFLLLERLTGSIISNDEVRFKSKKELEAVWDDALVLRGDMTDNSLDEGQVRQLLPRRQGEWVRWIGPVEMITKGFHWVPVGVDTAAGTLVGLPDRWRTRLGPVILEEARRREKALPQDERVRQAPATDLFALGGRQGGLNRFEEELRPGPWAMEFAESDLLFDSQAHDAALIGALETAESSLFVASAFVTKAAVDLLRAPLLSALGRGVDVDILWGYGAGTDQGEAVIEELKKVTYEARRDGSSGALRFNRVASGSHAKLLIYDPPGGMLALVGSYNWLSAFKAGVASINVSITLRHKGVVAEVCGSAAGLWAGAESEILSSTADRWRNIAADLERQVATEIGSEPTQSDPASSTVRLVFDREHEVIIREWSASAQRTFLVLSHRLGPAADSRLVRADESTADQFSVIYGMTELDDASLTRISDKVRVAGGTISKASGVHAKVVVADTEVCISSYNFLSADPFGTSNRARELGVVIEGGGVANWVVERLRHIVG